MAPPKKKGQTLSLHELHSLIPSGVASASNPSGGTGNWADDEIELPTAPLGLDSFSSSSSRPSSYGGGGGSERAIGRFPSGGAPNNRRDLSGPPAPYVPNLADLPRTAPFTAFVGNLPFDINEADIRRFFDEVAIVSIRLPMQDGRPRGTAFVEFAQQEGLVKGLLKNGTILNGRYPRIDIAQARSGEGESSSRSFANNWRDTPHEVVSVAVRPSSTGDSGKSRFTNDRPIERSKFVPSENAPLPAAAATTTKMSWRETAKPVAAEPIPVKPTKTADPRPPKLNLLPPTVKPSGSTEPRLAPEYSQKPPKSNPFGAARPREQVIAERTSNTKEEGEK